MKTTLFTGFLIVCSIALLSFAPVLHTDTYTVDTTRSQLNWTGEKVTGTHHGTIAIKNGTITQNHGTVKGSVVFDMNSIAVTDLSGDFKNKLEKHLKSEDFFGVEKHPTSEFVITSLTPLKSEEGSKNNFTVSGTLTIKGISQPLAFPAYVFFEGSGMTVSGEAKVDRTKYDIKYKSASFIEDIGDKAISDIFTLKLDVVATK
ncbi:MAG TPA: YceI family protein [Bacteroidia bacterium]|nr:YceI family protein [Bacteroidia bacterium]